MAAAGEQKESNLITLLRDTDRDGTVDERSDLLTDLASPFGVAWYDGTLYVAADRRHPRLSLRARPDRRSRASRKC